MTTARRGHALIALVGACALAGAGTAGTYALWSVTAGNEGAIDVVRYEDTPESSSDGAAESASAGVAGGTTAAEPGETASDGAPGAAGSGPAGSGPADGADTNRAGHAAQDPTTDADGGTAAAEDAPGPEHLDLPQELLDQVNDHGRGAAVLESSLDAGNDATVHLTLTVHAPELALGMQARLVHEPEDCRVTGVNLSVHDGTPVALEPGERTFYCLELEAATAVSSGQVTATGTSEAGDVSAQEDWEVTVHDTLTTDDVDVVLTPVTEVAP